MIDCYFTPAIMKNSDIMQGLCLVFSFHVLMKFEKDLVDCSFSGFGIVVLRRGNGCAQIVFGKAV